MAWTVQRSKLEIYIDILRAMASQGPMTITRLVSTIDMDREALIQQVDSLIWHNLTEEQNLSKGEKFYVITEKGVRVLKVIVTIDEEIRRKGITILSKSPLLF
jgi:predicted transcriptional regulator